MSEEKSFPKTSINWYPGHMVKTRRSIKEQIDLIDIVYEVIDARMPISSKIVDIDDLIKNKPRILLMTKYDLCDKEETNKFIKYYENLGYYVYPLDLINDKTYKHIINKSNELFKSINEERQKKGMKPRTLRALVMGVPNVGKSTLINRLVGKKATKVGDAPGVTKSLGWIRINKNIELLDSPGILWPKLENQTNAMNLAALSSIKEEIVDNEALSNYILNTLFKIYPMYLEKRYGLTSLNNAHEMIAKKRGALLKGGEVDYDKVYSIIIQDLKNGLFGPVTLDRI